MSDGEYRILLALISEEVEHEDSTVTYTHDSCELFVKDFGPKWGPCYKVSLKAVSGTNPGEILKSTWWLSSPWVMVEQWEKFTGHECPMQAEEIARVGKVAV
jgi:hypothetical protein